MQNYLSQLGTSTSCPVAVIIRDGQILSGLRNYTPDKWTSAPSVWTVPGGRCDAGETLEQTLRRETAEKVGITDLSITDYLGEVPGAKEGDVVYVFRCTTKQSPTLMEPEKFSEWKWFPVSEIPGNFINADLLRVIQGLKI